MSALDVLAWAALEAWWARNPTGEVRVYPWPSEDEAIGAFVMALPEPVKTDIARVHRYRRDPIIAAERELVCTEAGTP